jgi:hypothetical protein
MTETNAISLVEYFYRDQVATLTLMPITHE